MNGVGADLLLIAGIPATGKSTACRILARDHGFAHYDMECHPRGWPAPELKTIWDRSRPSFVSALRSRHTRIALDWGFPPHCLDWVAELQALGARLIWLTGDVAQARRFFIQRGGQSVSLFDDQVARIRAAHFPDVLNAQVIVSLTPLDYRDPAEVIQEILGQQG